MTHTPKTISNLSCAIPLKNEESIFPFGSRKEHAGFSLKRLISLLIVLIFIVCICGGCTVIEKTAELIERLRDNGVGLTEPSDTVSFKSPSDFKSENDLYYYDQLSDAGKTIYISLLDGIKIHSEKIYILPAAQEEIKKAYEALSYDNPDIICLASEYSWTESESYYTFMPSYTMTLEECEIKTSELRAVAWQVISQVPNGATEYQHALYFHDYIINSCSYSFDAITDYDNNKSAYTAYGALIEGQAVCEGYSRSMQLLMKLSEISCTIVLGDTVSGDPDLGETNGHMWNLAMIGGEWHHIDTTFDDETYSDPDSSGGSMVSHIYFNLSDIEIATDHFNISSPGLICTSNSYGYFLQTGRLVNSGINESEAAIGAILLNAFTLRESFIEIKFADSELYNNVFDSLVPNGSMYETIMDAADSAGIALDSGSLSLSRIDTQNVMRLKVVYVD